MKPLGNLACRVPQSQRLGNTPSPRLVPIKPGGEVYPKGGLVGHWRTVIFNNRFGPFTCFLVATIQALHNEALLALRVRGEYIRDSQTTADAAAGPDLSDPISGKYGGKSQIGLAQFDETSECNGRVGQHLLNSILPRLGIQPPKGAVSILSHLWQHLQELLMPRIRVRGRGYCMCDHENDLLDGPDRPGRAVVQRGHNHPACARCHEGSSWASVQRRKFTQKTGYPRPSTEDGPDGLASLRLPAGSRGSVTHEECEILAAVERKPGAWCEAFAIDRLNASFTLPAGKRCTANAQQTTGLVG